jgi:hypothetical protein
MRAELTAVAVRSFSLGSAIALPSGLGLCRGLGIVFSTQPVTGATWQLLATDVTGAVLNTIGPVLAWRGQAKTAAA